MVGSGYESRRGKRRAKILNGSPPIMVASWSIVDSEWWIVDGR